MPKNGVVRKDESRSKKRGLFSEGYKRHSGPIGTQMLCAFPHIPTNEERVRSVGDLEPFFGDWKCRPKTRATTPNEDRYLVLAARRHRNMNATLLQQHLRSATGTTVSTQTVRYRLHGVGLYAHRPMVCVRLTSRHRRNRREWATEHVNWRRNEWSNVLFLTSPVFLFIRVIGVFSSGGTVSVGIILRSCTKVSDLAVGECWCMVASPLTGAQTSTSFEMDL
ncbi:transposable element Tcb2 transposase [Trichonephila clavipes]|nr:transposable element Tcb2 transposase [Trichonephila clavipes]